MRHLTLEVTMHFQADAVLTVHLEDGQGNTQAVTCECTTTAGWQSSDRGLMNQIQTDYRFCVIIPDGYFMVPSRSHVEFGFRSLQSQDWILWKRGSPFRRDLLSDLVPELNDRV